MKILLVDDDVATAQIFATALKKEGFETDHAATGQEGIDKAVSGLPNLILLDQVLPDIQGNEVLKRLKADEKTKAIPIILLSNFNQEELVKEAINAGAIDYVAKYQVETGDVVNKVKEVLKV